MFHISGYAMELTLRRTEPREVVEDFDAAVSRLIQDFTHRFAKQSYGWIDSSNKELIDEMITVYTSQTINTERVVDDRNFELIWKRAKEWNKAFGIKFNSSETDEELGG